MPTIVRRSPQRSVTAVSPDPRNAAVGNAINGSGAGVTVGTGDGATVAAGDGVAVGVGVGVGFGGKTTRGATTSVGSDTAVTVTPMSAADTRRRTRRPTSAAARS